MANRWYLLLFGPAGGLLTGLFSGLVLLAITGQPGTWIGWFALCFSTVACFTLGGWLTFFQLSTRRSERRREVIERFAAGDLTVLPVSEGTDEADLQRLALSLRRALWQVQRVTTSVHRTARGVEEQARNVLEAARRQGAAVERSEKAVAGMGESLEGSGKRVTQLESFARETTTSLNDSVFMSAVTVSPALKLYSMAPF